MQPLIDNFHKDMDFFLGKITFFHPNLSPIFQCLPQTIDLNNLAPYWIKLHAQYPLRLNCRKTQRKN
jgi:hypothetical protein